MNNDDSCLVLYWLSFLQLLSRIHVYFDKRKERLQAKMTFAEKIANDKIFREKNPLYVKLEEEINELNQKVYNLQDKIRKRERVEERLTVCLKRTESIEEYKTEDHASE